MTRKKRSVLTKKQIVDIFQSLTDANPKPETELHFSNHYQLLIAVMFSAQTTDVAVNKATKRLFSIVFTPQDMLDFGLDALTLEIQSIGLYRNKAKHGVALSERLIRDHQGQVPNDMKDLMALPGVGRKTANVVLNTAFGMPTIAVDTHVFRVARRLGLSKSKDVDGVEEDLSALIPKKYLMDAHHHLILHGRYICKARRPLCETCDLISLCVYGRENFN